MMSDVERSIHTLNTILQKTFLIMTIFLRANLCLSFLQFISTQKAFLLTMHDGLTTVLLSHLQHSFDVIGLSETKIKSNCDLTSNIAFSQTVISTGNNKSNKFQSRGIGVLCKIRHFVNTKTLFNYTMPLFFLFSPAVVQFGATLMTITLNHFK